MNDYGKKCSISVSLNHDEVSLDNESLHRTNQQNRIPSDVDRSLVLPRLSSESNMRHHHNGQEDLPVPRTNLSSGEHEESKTVSTGYSPTREYPPKYRTLFMLACGALSISIVVCTVVAILATTGGSAQKRTVQVLESDVPLRNQHGLPNEVHLYNLMVPAFHQVECLLEGSTGDLDMYFNFGTIPDRGSSFQDTGQCTRTYKDGWHHHCSIASTEEFDSVLYIALRSRESYRNIMIVCFVQPYIIDQFEVQRPVVNERIVPLASGIPLKNQQALRGEVQIYLFQGRTDVGTRCEIDGLNLDSGSVEMFLRYNEIPEISFRSKVNACSHANSRRKVSCMTTWAHDSEPRLLYVALYAKRAFQSVSLMCIEDIFEIKAGTEVTMFGKPHSVLLYYINVPSSHMVTCDVQSGSDIYFRENAIPEIDGESLILDETSNGYSHQIMINAEDTDTTLYIAQKTTEVETGYFYVWCHLINNAKEILELENGILLDNQSGTVDIVNLYVIQVPIEHFVACKAWGSNFAELAFRFDEIPRLSTGEYFCFTGDSICEITVSPRDADRNTTLYIAILAYEPYNDISLSCNVNAFVLAEFEDGEILEIYASTDDTVQCYVMKVPKQHSVACKVWGDKLVADVYFRFDEIPGTTHESVENEASCYTDSLNETYWLECTRFYEDRTLYIAFTANEPYGADAYLSCTLTSLVVAEQILELENGVRLEEHDGLEDVIHVYSMKVPKLHSVTCKVSGDDLVAMLYFRFDEIPGINLDYECEVWGDRFICFQLLPLFFQSASSEIDRTLYIALHALEPYRSAYLSCSATVSKILELESGVAIEIQNGTEYAVQYYSIQVPKQHKVTCEAWGNNLDADLYFRFDSVPEIIEATLAYDASCRTWINIGFGSCTTPTLDWLGNSGTERTLYIALYPSTLYSSAYLSCNVTAFAILELESGVPNEIQIGTEDIMQLYAMQVPKLHSVTCEVWGSTEAEVYVRLNEAPEVDGTSAPNECRGWINSYHSYDSCTTGSTGMTSDSILYVTLKIWTDSWGFWDDYETTTLVCTVQPYIPWETPLLLPGLGEGQSCTVEDIAARTCLLDFQGSSSSSSSSNCIHCAMMMSLPAIPTSNEAILDSPVDQHKDQEQEARGCVLSVEEETICATIQDDCDCEPCVSEVARYVACVNGLSGGCSFVC